ncbi:MAG: hypothetical protein D6693_03820 [Planctomycetota bacterium]|nr:MAG: hypothetical protein D6693_03820 [Planctomycetota bacterium]
MSAFWLIFGFFGQALFFMRFVVQWISSERQKKSVIPLAFWWFSIAGGMTLLTYAIYRKDPVFIAGQSIGLFVYLRNLILIGHERRAAGADAAPPSPVRLLAPIAAAAVVIGGGVWVWDQHVKDHLIPRNTGVVEPGSLYRAGRQTPSTFRMLHDRWGVRTIVDLGAYRPGTPEERAARETTERLGIERHRFFNLRGDATGNPNEYVAALRLMSDPSKRPLLVMCAAGAQRTGLAVLLYRRIVQGVPFERAYPELERYGHEPGKDWRLLTYLAEHYHEIKEAYETGGWIPGSPPPEEVVTGSSAPTADAPR